MNKVLVSWFSPELDFVNNQINQNGPTILLYKTHYDYDFHILLVSESQVALGLEFKKQIEGQFGNVFLIIKPQSIEKLENNYQAIKNSAEQVLMELKKYQIDLLVTTGNNVQRATWFLVHYSLNLKTRLIDVEIYKPSGRAKIYQLDFDTSSVPVSAIIRQELIQQEHKEKLILTQSYEPVYDLAFKFAQAENIPILILGPRGSGKEELARYIHNNSPTRRRKTVLVIDAEANESKVVEFKLFGFKKGAFPGATGDYRGMLVDANGGTLIIKNFDKLDMALQNRIFAFIKDGVVDPIVGRTKKVNVRLIFTTTKKLNELLEQNLISDNLFYVLSARLTLPDFYMLPVDEKRSIINELLSRKAKTFKRKDKLVPCLQLWDFLLSYKFPGNFLELNTMLDNFYIVTEHNKNNICVEVLPSYVKYEEVPKSLLLEEVEKVHIEKVLKMFRGNKSRTARALGVALNTLKKKIRDYNIDLEKLLAEDK